MNTPGSRIKSLRKEAKLTQKELGKKIGVSAVSVTQWEKDVNLPRGENANLLCRILNSSWEWIAHGKGEPHLTPKFTGVKESLVSYGVKYKLPLFEKQQLGSYFDGSSISNKQANAEIATALGAGPKTFAYIETSEGMMHRISPKDTVYIDPEGKLEPNSIGIFLFKAGMDYQLGTLKSTPGGLMLQFDSNEPGWNSIAVDENDYMGRLVAFVPHWLGE
jgi:transcriptional regulator with XRE-family HTH domain